MEARRPFDLEHGPLLRARFYRREGGEHALLVVVHHLVADFWSLARLARELSAAYAAAVRGTPVELPEVGATYLDFVRWQRALLEAFLVWDNAYGEIAGDELPRQVRANVVTVRSFSKCYALAGARIGYCIGDRALVAELLQHKDAFNAGAFPQAVALEALARREHFVQLARELSAARARLAAALRALGFEVRPARGNFLLARHPARGAATLQEGLAGRKIAVRRFPGDAVRDYLQITVPPAPGADRLLEAFRDLLGSDAGPPSPPAAGTGGWPAASSGTRR